MKRSRCVRLVMMSSVPVLLTACGGSQEPTIYQSVDNCVQAGELTYTECRQRFDEAVTQHQQTAPRFNSRESCAAEWGDGQCQTAPASGGGVFMPAMAGFMMGQALNNFSGRGTPLYRNRNDPDTWRTGSREVVKGTVAGSPVTRNGFGASSTRRSSFGG